MTSAAVHVGQLLQPIPGGIGRYVRALVGALPGVGVDVHGFAAGPAPAGIAPYTDLGRPTGAVRYESWHRLRRPVGPPAGPGRRTVPDPKASCTSRTCR